MKNSSPPHTSVDSSGHWLARLGLLALLGSQLSGCAPKPEAVRSDVLLITVERLHWSETSVGGGPAAMPTLNALAASGVELSSLVSPSPDGAPAIASLLTGALPADHGILRGDIPPRETAQAHLALAFDAQGYRTAAISNLPALPPGTGLDGGFQVWMVPDRFGAFPALEARRDPRDTIRMAQHWIQQDRAHEPFFLWIHLAEPTPPQVPAAARAGQLAGLDRVLDGLFQQVRLRGEQRGAQPVLAFTHLADHGPDPARAESEAFLLAQSAVRVHALVSAPGLSPGTCSELAGLDEFATLLPALASGADTRLADLLRGSAGEARAEVAVTSTLGTATFGLPPLEGAIRADGMSWGKTQRPDEAALRSTETLQDAVTLVRTGRHSEAIEKLRALKAAHPEATGPRLALAIVLAQSGELEAASKEAMELGAAVPTASWQAGLTLSRLGVASGSLENTRASTRTFLEGHPGDEAAMTLALAVARREGGGSVNVELLQSLVETWPSNAEGQLAMARLYASVGQSDTAASAFQLALARRPLDRGLLLEGARMLTATGDYWTALDFLSRHVTVYQENPANLAAIADVYEAGGRWPMVVIYHHKTLKLDPTNQAAQGGLARALEHVTVPAERAALAAETGLAL